MNRAQADLSQALLSRVGRFRALRVRDNGCGFARELCTLGEVERRF